MDVSGYLHSPGRFNPDSHWVEGWVDPKSLWPLWRGNKSLYQPEMKHSSVGIAVHSVFDLSQFLNKRQLMVNIRTWLFTFKWLRNFFWHTTQWDEGSSDASDLFPLRISVRTPDILTEDFVGSVRPSRKILNSKHLHWMPLPLQYSNHIHMIY